MSKEINDWEDIPSPTAEINDWEDIEVPEEESILKQVARGVISAVPAVGALAGGALASAGTLGLGSVAGGALGYAGGKEVEGLLNKYLLDEEGPSTAPIDQLGRVAGNIAEGATYEMGGQILGKGIEKATDLVGSGAKWVGNKASTTAEEMAANNLGVNVATRQEQQEVGRRILDSKLQPILPNKENFIPNLEKLVQGPSLRDKEIGVLIGEGQRELLMKPTVNVIDRAMDWGLGLGGFALGGPVGGATGVALLGGKKLIQSAPGQRTLALGLNNIGKILESTPEVLGKFAPILQKAAERGGNSLAATHFLLQQTQPEYQEITLNLGNEE